MKTLWLIICFSLALGIQAYAQDNIYLERIGESFQYYYQPKAGDTWYGVAKKTGTDLSQLKRLNQKVQSLGINSVLKIPVNKIDIYTNTELVTNSKTDFVPVYYSVQPKDNLFQISRRYFFQNTGELMRKNDMNTIALDMNSFLLVGWLPREKVLLPSILIKKDEPPFEIDLVNETIPIDEIDSPKHNEIPIDTTEVVSIAPEVIDSVDITAEKLPKANNLKQISRNGIGYCDVNLPDGERFFVLHNKAKINSVIRLTNKLANRNITATVVDRIPSNIYPKDVNVLISPGLAKKLGVRDKRFRIDMDYFVDAPAK